MNDRPTVHDDLEAYVLGALDPLERGAFARHLAICEACRSEAESYAAVMDSLSRVEQPAPPPRPGLPPIPLRRYGSIARRYGAIAAIFVFGILGVWAIPSVNGYVHAERDYSAIAQMLASDAQQVALTGSGATGRAIVGDRRRLTGFVATGLPPAAPGLVYRVYVHANGRRMSPGTLEPTSNGLEILVVRGDMLRGANLIRIMREPLHRGDASAARRMMLQGYT